MEDQEKKKKKKTKKKKEREEVQEPTMDVRGDETLPDDEWTMDKNINVKKIWKP